ncbi:MAG: glycosyltransferase [Anaerolineales bacterium]|nr:glycosyltransferase [Anaerolineales bacterium]
MSLPAAALHGLAWAAAGALLAFTLRRAALLVAALWPEHTAAAVEPHEWPRVTALVACRDEAASLPGLFAALEALDYPRDRLRVVIVDDGSTDNSAALARAWAAGYPWASTLLMNTNAGKAQALNQALQSLQPRPDAGDDLVVIYDADHTPAPGSLKALAAAFTAQDVAGASGQMRVSNGDASPAAAYSAIESLVNQFVTMRAKDRLRLAPALLGSNCAYRGAALAAVGGFRRGALLEDSDLTVALAQAGGRTRFVAASVSEHRAPVTLRGYVRQHLRWNRGFHQVSGLRLGDLWRRPGLSLPHKLELTFFALGYADRLALLAGAACTAVDAWRPGTFGFPLWVWAAYFGLPALEMAAAPALAGERPAAYARLAVVPFFFVIDIAIAAWAAAQSALRRPARWAATERAPVKP